MELVGPRKRRKETIPVAAEAEMAAGTPGYTPSNTTVIAGIMAGVTAHIIAMAYRRITAWLCHTAAGLVAHTGWHTSSSFESHLTSFHTLAIKAATCRSKTVD